MAASARRGLMDLAISMGRVPASTGRLLPSGRVISMMLIGNFQRNTRGGTSVVRRHRRATESVEENLPQRRRDAEKDKTRVRRCTGKFSDRKSTRLNSSHANISYAVFCLKKKT